MEQRRDKLIKVPPITPDGSVLLTDREVKQFQADYDNLSNILHQFVTLLLAVIVMNNDKNTLPDTLMIPKDLIDRVEGAKIVLEEKEHGIFARISDRPDNLISLEGRRG